jgi:2-polyprenyl-3-methyl-5-hydroxy-6-metoxy-1,4-benzoquinol methylase
MFSLQSFYETYETDTVEIVVGGRKFNILQPRNLDPFINAGDELHHFPLWVKLWKASWVLAGYLAEKPVEKNKHFLEIGAGLGLVSIVAATCGHKITLSEYNPDALQFARANAHLNHCPRLPIVKLDWNRPQVERRFDYIVASEVVYKEEDFRPLLNLFTACLKPGGEIILASEMRKTSGEFYRFLQPIFHIEVMKKILRSQDEQTLVTVFRLKAKKSGLRTKDKDALGWRQKGKAQDSG